MDAHQAVNVKHARGIVITMPIALSALHAFHEALMSQFRDVTQEGQMM
jgi:hypothetical protein